MTGREPLVKILPGALRGRERDGVLLFAGIPYAAPVTGARRWAAPEPHEGWSGMRDARRFGPAAPQRPGTGLTAAPHAWDEDCLTLNVTTPALDDARRPVLFWIHGGGFLTGKGGIPWYDGSSFARRGDVVTVSINYRLGALGFIHLDPLLPGIPGAGLLGLHDQIAALEWVRDHIAAFGGDPGRVTIAGESAGAMSVGTLLGMPRARGLFHGAIAQSGACHHTHGTTRAGDIAGRLIAALGSPGDADALRALDVDAILDAQQQVQAALAAEPASAGGISALPFQPVVDRDALPAPPLDAVRAGSVRDVPLLVGTNRDETTLFGYHQTDDRRLERLAGHIFSDAEAAIAAYRATRPEASPGELATAITTDQIFRIPAVRLCEAQHAAGGDVFAYEFSWRSRAFGGKLGATHALEVPFAFHTLDRPGVEVFLGEGPLPTDLAAATHAAWTAFVRTGDPNADALGVAWPRYAAGSRRVLELGDAIRPLEDPGGAERALWDGLL